MFRFIDKGAHYRPMRTRSALCRPSQTTVLTPRAQTSMSNPLLSETTTDGNTSGKLCHISLVSRDILTGRQLLISEPYVREMWNLDESHHDIVHKCPVSVSQLSQEMDRHAETFIRF